MLDNILYFDYSATTPIDEKVVAVMTDIMKNNYGNPSSAEHAYGWAAEAVIDRARLEVASLIGASESEIIFTSGATEANNLAIKGLFEFYGDKKNHIITSVTEHKAVIDVCSYLQRQYGANITYLAVDKNGLIDLDELKSSIGPKTLLISIMGVNNEIGVIQPLEQIGKICKENGVFFHSDAAQAFGKIELDVIKLNIDLMSISAHKIYGPKGIGALYVNKKNKMRLSPQMHGGGQEKNLRSGTLATHQIAGLGAASNIAASSMAQDYIKIAELSEFFISYLKNNLDYIKINGDVNHRYPGNLNISFENLNADKLVLALKNIAVSSGSACASLNTEPSYVLAALGLTKQQINSSLRFSIGRMTQKSDVEYAAKYLTQIIKDRVLNK